MFDKMTKWVQRRKKPPTTPTSEWLPSPDLDKSQLDVKLYQIYEAIMLAQEGAELVVSELQPQLFDALGSSALTAEDEVEIQGLFRELNYVVALGYR